MTTEPLTLPEHPLSRFLRRRSLAALPAPTPPAPDLDALATRLFGIAQRADALRYDSVRYDRTITHEEAGTEAGIIAVELRDLATTLDTHNRRSRQATT